MARKVWSEKWGENQRSKGVLGVEEEWTEVISIEHCTEIEAGPSNSSGSNFIGVLGV